MIHLVCALFHEAKPLIEKYGLKQIVNQPYSVYANKSISLIVSGVGKKKSAEATRYLYESSGKNRNVAWLNIGIAGHRDYSLGQGYLIHKITDSLTGKSWYPPQILKSHVLSASVLTVEKACFDYSDDTLYEMEASGFYEAAASFSTGELVQCFKIISDNQKTLDREINRSSLSRFIEQNLDLIDSVQSELSQLSDWLCALERAPAEVEHFLKRLHFTVTERHQLSRMLKRLGTLLPEREWFPESAHLKTASEILSFLESQIDLLPVAL